MKLIKLSIKNFKGIREYNFVINGKNASVFGANEAGKTTLFDAFLWLLFDKDSLNQKQFDIKTTDSNGNVISKLDHEVEGVLLHDGREVVLKKVYKEKYTKKRGQPAATFTGHTTEYFIDETPVSKTAYNAKIAEIAVEEKRFQLLTNPTFFASKLSWQEQREILLGVCGLVTDEDIIATSSNLSEVLDMLDGKSVDDFKKTVNSKRKKINEQLKSIPARVDEVKRNLPDLEVTNTEGKIKELTSLRKQLGSKNQEISTTKAGGGVAELRLQITGFDGRIQKIANENESSVFDDIQAKKKELSALEDVASATEKTRQQATADRGLIVSEVSNITEVTNHIREDWHRVNDTVFTEETCPTCKQELPVGQVELARAAFMKNRSESLASINEKGRANKEKIEQLLSKDSALAEFMLKTEKEQAGINDSVLSIKKEIEALNSNAPVLLDNPEYAKAVKERAELLQQITDIEAGSTAAVDRLNVQVAEIETSIAEAEAHVAAIENSHKAHDRIVELEGQEKELSRQFEELEGQLFLIDQFEIARASYLGDLINSNFSLVTFKLFNQQINEGVQPTCEVMVNGVPYKSLNSAARVQAGIDIINTLSGYYGFKAPVFIDNRESVTEIPDIDSQVINMVVSPMDKELRIEIEDDVVQKGCVVLASIINQRGRK